MWGRIFTYSCSLEEDWTCVAVGRSVSRPCREKFDDAFISLEKSLQNSVDRDSQLAKFQLKGHTSGVTLVGTPTKCPKETHCEKSETPTSPSLNADGSILERTAVFSSELIAAEVQAEGESNRKGTLQETVAEGRDSPSPGEPDGKFQCDVDGPSGNGEGLQGGVHVQEVFPTNLEGLQAFDLPREEGVTTPNRPARSDNMICSPGFDYSPVESPPEAAPNAVSCSMVKQFQFYALPSLTPPPGQTSSFNSFAGPANTIRAPAPKLPRPSQRDPSPSCSAINTANTTQTAKITPPQFPKTLWTSAAQNLTEAKTQTGIPRGGVRFLSAGGRNLSLSEKQMSRAAALFADINDGEKDGLLRNGNLGKRGREDENVAIKRDSPQLDIPKRTEMNDPGIAVEGEPPQRMESTVPPCPGSQAEGVENQGFGLFQMASGKVPRVSIESTDRARALLHDGENPDCGFIDGERNPKGQRLAEGQRSPHGGRTQQPLSARPDNLPTLVTGAGGPVRVSNTKLMAARSMLGPPSEFPPIPNANLATGRAEQTSFGPMSQSNIPKDKDGGFSFPRLETGAGRHLEVSKSGIQRVKARLGLPASGTAAAVDGNEEKATNDAGKASSSLVDPRDGPCNPPFSQTPTPQCSPLSESRLATGSGRVPPTALAALSSLTPVLRPKLMGSASSERRAFAKPRRSLEGPIGPPTKRQGKSRRSWRPLVPSNLPGGFQAGKTPTCPQQQPRLPLHELYKESQSRPTIAEHFGKTPQAKSPLWMNPDTARDFVFADGTSLQGLRGEMLKCGCDPEYASGEWCRNHFQWIVWKLASHDSIDGGCSLTPAAVLHELKYRYEVEFGQGDRSILHMIFEQDWAANGPMVLLVSRILKQSINGRIPSSRQAIKVELTDGWYPIFAQPDTLLTKLIEAGGISVGDKLRLTGASLIAGRPDEPLEAVKSSTLRFHYNGCHPVPWDEPLGVSQSGESFSISPLGSVEPNGGPISRTLVCVVRKYPLMYWGKLPSGVGISRTPKAWERAKKCFGERVTAMEAQVQEEIQRRALTESLNAVGGGGGIVEKVAHDMLRNGGSSDCGVDLTMDQKQELSRYLEEQQARMQAMGKTLLQERLDQADVHEVQGSPYICLMVSSVHLEQETANKMSTSNAIIKVWRPGEDFSSVQEGGVYDIRHLNVTGKSNGILELSTQASTKWEFVATHSNLPEQLTTKFSPRERVTLHGLINLPTQSSFDFEGCIVFVGSLLGDVGGWNFHQWVFLVDETVGGDMPLLLAIKLSGSIESVDFLDHRSDRGSICLFKDIEKKQVDAVNGLLVSHSSEFSSHEFGGFKKRGGNRGKLGEWMDNSKDLLDSLTARIEELVSKG